MILLDKSAQSGHPGEAARELSPKDRIHDPCGSLPNQNIP